MPKRPESAAADHARVDTATSTRGVADAFRDLARPTASIDADCDDSTGEPSAIVLGFIPGILPGLILLILLC